MFKKILIGMALLAAACAIGAAGYRTGKHLAIEERNQAATSAPR